LSRIPSLTQASPFCNSVGLGKVNWVNAQFSLENNELEADEFRKLTFNGYCWIMNPRQAPIFWERMSATWGDKLPGISINSTQDLTLEFRKLNQQMPKAMKYYEAAK